MSLLHSEWKSFKMTMPFPLCGIPIDSCVIKGLRRIKNILNYRVSSGCLITIWEICSQIGMSQIVCVVSRSLGDWDSNQIFNQPYLP